MNSEAMEASKVHRRCPNELRLQVCDPANAGDFALVSSAPDAS